MLIWFGCRSFEDVCSRLEDLLDTLSTLLSDNADLSKDDLVQLAFFSIRTVNSVFSSMSQNEKELNRQILSRMLTNVKSYTPVVFTPEQLKEVETMLVSCNTVVVGSSTTVNDKDVDVLVAPLAENAKQEVSSVSEESDVLDAMPIRTSNTTTPPNPAAAGYPVRTSNAGYPVRTSNQNTKQSDSLKTQTSVSKNRMSLPLLDLHKDHDMDSLPSPTRENTNPLPLGKALFEGDAAFRPEWPAPRAVVQRYDTDALKAVSTYQQKFSRSSFFSNDLPSPTPSEDSGGDAGGDFGGEVSSFSTVSKPNIVTQTTTVQSKTFSTPHVERPSVQLHANARNSAPVYSTSSSVTRVANKTRDPRLRLTNPESSSDSNQGTVPLPRKQPAIEPLVGLVQSSRKQKIVDEPVLVDGPALKRQKNEFGDSSNSRNIMSVSQARGFENGVTTSSLPSASAGNMPIPVTGVSTSSASLQSILKDIAVNPSQWMNLLNMEQQKSVDPAKYVTQSVSQNSFQAPVQMTAVASQPMMTGPWSTPMTTVTSQPLATGPWSTPMTTVTSQPLVTGSWSTPMTIAASQPLVTGPRSTAEMQTPQTASGDDSGKVRMKPRDPRRALQSKSLQKSETVTSSSTVEGTKGNSKQADPRVSSKQADPRASSKQADPRASSKQADPRASSKQADPRASFQTSSTPDITRQFTKNLKNIADLVSSTASAPVQISQPAPVQISQPAPVQTSQPAQVHSSFVNMKGLPSQPVRLQNGTGQTSEEAASKPQNAWGDVEHLFGRYDDQERAAIQRERSKRMEEQKKMFAERKLCLVLDLDHTLLNSAKFSEIEPMHDELLRKKEEQDRDKQHRHLFRFPHMSMWTKLRPGIWKFLEKASQLYELHLYTMGNKLYATEMAKVLDPKGVLFNGRVISRGDDGDNVDGDPKSKDLEGVLGMESAVVIIDDSIRVWPHNKLNLIVVERYIYFPCSRRQFGLPGPSLLEIDHDERPDEGTLASSLAVIEKIHQNFFMEKSLDDADVRNILASEQRKILGGCRIVFSRVFPVGESSPHMHPLWQTAEQFGAVCTNQLDEQVTHVVANSLGTDKVNWALATGRPVVHPGWVEASALLYRRANEQDFAVKP
ncbi:BRCT domain-containing protein [Artemisia annua]|uniref:protein-serine/threonine phosphatase n=1 Tax=Artemisia annua TaxID=35608 RepID=A0A2U1P398_ARTAN|nr:BRCT domain-containing protein [Artemisia annua]